MRTGLLLLTLFLLLSPSTRAASEREITVSGSCFREITPDRGAIIVTVDVLDPDLKKSTKQATATYEKLRSKVTDLKLKQVELRTVEYSVYEQKEWQNNRSVSKGFKTRMGLRVSSSEIARLGEVTEVASELQIREVGALSTFLSDELAEAEKINCLKDAAQNARNKAEKLASALGASLGPVLQIREGGEASSPIPRPMMMKANLMAEDSRGGAPTIEAGKQSLAETIAVTFSLK